MARWWGGTRALRSSRSGSGKAWGSRLGEPRYVVRIDAQSREVVLGTKDELARRELSARGANWFFPPQPRFECQVKIRYRSAAVDAVVETLPGDRFHVEFREPCYGVAPGQAAVCYRGDEVLAGAGSTESRRKPAITPQNPLISVYSLTPN